MLHQPVPLLFGYHTFCNHLQRQVIGKPDDGIDNSDAGITDTAIPGERLVYFELVQRQALEVTQGGVASTKIVQPCFIRGNEKEWRLLMSLETGVLVSMSLGILGGGVLTAWCLYSRHCEKKASRE